MAMQMAPLFPVTSAERVRLAIRMLRSQTEYMLEDFDAAVLQAKVVAEDLERHHHDDPEFASDLQSATRDMLVYSDHLRRHNQALVSLDADFRFTPTQATDFRKVLEGYVNQLNEEDPFDPDGNDALQQFRKAVWDVHHAGQPLPPRQLEDVVVMAGSQTIPNTTCPITGKPVDRLDSPVRSQQCRHIYERAAVMDFLRTHFRGQVGTGTSCYTPCKCAAAGCPGTLVVCQLVCDDSLNADIQQYMSTIDDFAECTLLEDDTDTPGKSAASCTILSGDTP